jgi:tetratricopeptide (TPR) repeat protein
MPDAGACGPLANPFGPWDYRADHFVPLALDNMSHAEKLSLVERNHFTPEVDALIRGSSGTVGGDLDYTLRAFPNHPRALLAMMRYGERLKTPQVPGAHYSVECYFQRAIRFKADDAVVRMLYATFLIRENRKAEALQQLAVTRRAAGDNAFTHYNLGLIYFDLGDFELALGEAHKAIALGFPKTALKDRLVSAQKWVEPAASAPK